MQEIEECMELLLKHARPQDCIYVPIEKAAGMVLAEDIYAPMAVPPFPRAAMDGYAVRAQDLETAEQKQPVTLLVIGENYAGEAGDYPYRPKTAVRIMTGGMIPKDFDAVVRQEDTDYGEMQVRVYKSVAPYSNYCKEGEDIAKGEKIAGKGERLTPLHLGLLAEVGIPRVLVKRPVRVAILCTGSELMLPGTALDKGKIYNNISFILGAQIENAGLSVCSRKLVADEGRILIKELENALEEADLVITTGAVSVGKRDIVPRILEEIGAEILFRRANVQPGTPTIGSVADDKIILSLSGNPYAAMVNFELYFWELVAHMMGHDSFKPLVQKAELISEYSKINKMRRFVRAYAENGKVSLPAQVHASSVISNLTGCNCLIDLPAGRRVEVGDTVTVRMIKGMGF